MKSARADSGAGHPAAPLSVAAAIVMVLTMFVAACSEKEPEAPPEVIRPVKVLKVATGGDVSGLELPGKVRASQRVDLAFQEVGGRLVELSIAGREGERVQEGDLLARIDPTDFQVSLQNAQGQLNEAESSVKLAESEYERVQRIRKQDPGAVSTALVDRRREALNQARGRIKSLQAVVADARNRLAYTYLRAPFGGVIAKRYVDNFQEVQPKQPIVSLQAIDNIEILVDAPENLVALSEQTADRVKVFTEFPTAPGKRLPLQFKEAASEADPATQTYQVTFQMAQPEGVNALPGMTTRVFVEVSGSADADSQEVRVPAIAVVSDPEGKAFVWVLDTQRMTVHRSDVTLGPPVGSDSVVVEGGLKGGVTIVTAGVLSLKEGQKVRIWER